MALDPALVGHSFAPTEPYEVGREKVREFAAAIGLSDPAHLDPDAAAAMGHPDLLAPPTFPVVVATARNRFLINDPLLDIDYSRVVHGDQRFAYTRPVYAGDRLVCHSQIEDIMSRGGYDMMTLRTDVSTESGEPVVTVWSKLVIRDGAE
jgi:acyl dehydratase